MIKLVPLSRGIPMNQLMRMKSPIYTAQNYIYHVEWQSFLEGIALQEDSANEHSKYEIFCMEGICWNIIQKKPIWIEEKKRQYVNYATKTW